MNSNTFALMVDTSTGSCQLAGYGLGFTFMFYGYPNYSHYCRSYLKVKDVLSYLF